jgi:uncharacterized protein
MIKEAHCKITHTRTRPVPHHFKSRSLLFQVVLGHELPHFWQTFPYRFRRRDHPLLVQKESSARDSVLEYCQKNNISLPDRPIIELTTHLSLWGYNFNPISFYIIKDQAHSAHTVLLEVSNTYRECKVFVLQNPKRDIFELECAKDFYISPFINPIGKLQIKIEGDQNAISARVDSYEQEELVLSASLCGSFTSTTIFSRFKSLILYPLNTIRIMTLIHFHALLLYVKGIAYHSKADSQNKQKGLLYVDPSISKKISR